VGDDALLEESEHLGIEVELVASTKYNVWVIRGS
jgi:hypothetical protein